MMSRLSQEESAEIFPTGFGVFARSASEDLQVGQLVTYGMSFRTNFNGFYSNQIHEVQDKPLMSIYEADENYNVKTLFA